MGVFFIIVGVFSISWVLFHRVGMLIGMPLIEKMHFQKYFLNMDISLNTKDPDLKFEMCIHQLYTQGSVSQNIYLGPSFYFIESRK